ncbi:MAG: hypothetical protein KC713_10455, partial [Candidatus Omnitrophica bacterium]|nr:hypothetical protein [Candidatus Omnitrophota bacterium]
GIDAWTSNSPYDPSSGFEDLQTQNTYMMKLWHELLLNWDLTIGASVMDYSDEWWRPKPVINKNNHTFTQDYLGSGPSDFDCDGQFDTVPAVPDQYIQEEWLGIVSVQQSNEEPVDQVIPRKVYYSLKDVFSCPLEKPFFAGPSTDKSCDGTNICCPHPDEVSYNGQCAPYCPKN